MGRQSPKNRTHGTSYFDQLKVAPTQRTWPAQIQDVQRAKYIRANAAQFRRDPNRMRQSAVGRGHLATMVALRTTRGIWGRVGASKSKSMANRTCAAALAGLHALLTNVMVHPVRVRRQLRDISTGTFASPDVSSSDTRAGDETCTSPGR